MTFGSIPCVWIYGKAEPGWYVARWLPDPILEEHWKRLGYAAVTQATKPDWIPSA